MQNGAVPKKLRGGNLFSEGKENTLFAHPSCLRFLLEIAVLLFFERVVGLKHLALIRRRVTWCFRRMQRHDARHPGST